MGKGSYLGGSTVIRGVTGFAGKRSAVGTMTLREVQADLDNREKVSAARAPTPAKAPKKARPNSQPTAKSPTKAQAKAEHRALQAAKKAERVVIDPMEGVVVTRYTNATLRLRKPDDATDAASPSARGRGR